MRLNHDEFVALLAKALDSDEEDASRALEAWVDAVVHETEENGSCSVSGLGTFRKADDGSMILDPDTSLSMEVNYKYAGMSPIEVSPPKSVQPDADEDAASEAESETEADTEADIEAADAAPGISDPEKPDQEGDKPRDGEEVPEDKTPVEDTEQDIPESDAPEELPGEQDSFGIKEYEEEKLPDDLDEDKKPEAPPEQDPAEEPQLGYDSGMTTDPDEEKTDFDTDFDDSEQASDRGDEWDPDREPLAEEEPDAAEELEAAERDDAGASSRSSAFPKLSLSQRVKSSKGASKNRSRDKSEKIMWLIPIAALLIVAVLLYFHFDGQRLSRTHIGDRAVVQDEIPVPLPEEEEEDQVIQEFVPSPDPVEEVAPPPDPDVTPEPVEDATTEPLDDRIRDLALPYGLMGPEDEVLIGAYTIVVHSLRNERKSEIEKQRLESQGYKATRWSAELPGGITTYRVGIGQFQTVSEAERAIEELPEPFRSNNFIIRIR